MQHQQQLRSEILKYITGVENIHCTVGDPDKTRKLYSALFGPPQHEDGLWSEFNVAGLDIAVTFADKPKFVITFKVERLAELKSVLARILQTKLEIQHGDYGDYVEVCPDEGYCMHFFEPKVKCSS